MTTTQTTFVQEVQLALPVAFPATEFTEFRTWGRAHLLQPKGDAWREFGSASNLIAWRFRTAFEAMDRYRKSWWEHGANVPFEELYTREQSLFVMFASGVSCGEATCYAVHAALSDSRLLALPFAKRDQITSPDKLESILQRLSLLPDPRFQAPDLLDALKRMTYPDSSWKRWLSLRNRMSHRSNLPMQIFGAMGAAPPPPKALNFAATSSTTEFEGDVTDLALLVESLAQQIRDIMAGVIKLELQT
jgi:hypothetical protein